MKSRLWMKYIRCLCGGLLALLFFSSGQPAAGQQSARGWSAPRNLSNSETQSDYPSLAVDPAGGVHVVWQEEAGDGRIFIRYAGLKDGAWTPANDIITSPDSQVADYPSLAADSQGYLHLAWRGDATLYYSRAYALLAGSAQNWSEPAALEYTQNYIGRPYLIGDAQDRLHLVYPIIIGGNSGIYYQASSDGGRNWSEPVAIYKNNRADRTISLPRLAIDPDGALHAVWVEAGYPESFPALGLRYAASRDSGQTWSEPVSLADGPYDSPQIVAGPRSAPGKAIIHLVYSGTAGDRYKFHRWSADGGRTWEAPFRNTEVGGLQGLPALAFDSNQVLHWLTSASIFNIRNDGLYHIEWQDGDWHASEILMRNQASEQNLQDVAAATVLGNELHVVVQFPLNSANQPSGWQNEIFYLRKDLASPRLPASTLPAPTPRPATPTPTPAANLAATWPAILNKTPSRTAAPLEAIGLGVLAAVVGMLGLAWFASLRQRP